MAPPAVAAPVVEGLARDILDISLAPRVEREHFPANTKNETGTVGGVKTIVSSIHFSDKIMITISQAGRLSQWVRSLTSLVLELHTDHSSHKVDSGSTLHSFAYEFRHTSSN